MKKPFIVILALSGLLAASLSISMPVAATSGTLNVPGGSTGTIPLGSLNERTVVSYSWSTNDNTQNMTFMFVGGNIGYGMKYQKVTGVASGSGSFTVPDGDDNEYLMAWTYNTGQGPLATITYDYSIQESSSSSSPPAFVLFIGFIVFVVIIIFIIMAVRKSRSRKPKPAAEKQMAQYNYPQIQQPHQYAPPPVPPQVSPHSGGFCGSCGKPLTPENKFCPSCGAPR